MNTTYQMGCTFNVPVTFSGSPVDVNYICHTSMHTGRLSTNVQIDVGRLSISKGRDPRCYGHRSIYGRTNGESRMGGGGPFPSPTVPLKRVYHDLNPKTPLLDHFKPRLE